MSWTVDGVVDETRLRALVYNGPSETLLAQFERKIAERHFVQSIYVRRRSETEYRKLFGPDEFTSGQDVVVAEAVPVAYFLIWTHARASPRISSIQGVTADGTSLICTVGRPKPRSGGNGHGGGYTVEYFLCRLETASATLEPLTLLRHTFF